MRRSRTCVTAGAPAKSSRCCTTANSPASSIRRRGTGRKGVRVGWIRARHARRLTVKDGAGAAYARHTPPPPLAHRPQPSSEARAYDALGRRVNGSRAYRRQSATFKPSMLGSVLPVTRNIAETCTAEPYYVVSRHASKGALPTGRLKKKKISKPVSGGGGGGARRETT
jgi:hypothetical protein